MRHAQAGSGDRGRPTRRVPEVRLYRDLDNADHWIAWSAKIGWVHFWARPNGWAERVSVADLDDLHLSEIPTAQALNTSLIAAFQHQAQTPTAMY